MKYVSSLRVLFLLPVSSHKTPIFCSLFAKIVNIGAVDPGTRAPGVGVGGV